MAEPKSSNEFDPYSSASPELPPALRTYSPLSAQGDGVIVHWGRHRPNYFPEYRSSAVQILITFEATLAELSYSDGDGNVHCRTIEGQNIWILPSDLAHGIYWRRETLLAWLFVERELIVRLGASVPAEHIIWKMDDAVAVDTVIGTLSVAMREECELLAGPNHESMHVMGKCLASRVLRAQGKLACNFPATITRLHPEVRARLVRFIHANISQQIAIGELAKEARMSVSHFGVVFKATTGLTPEQFILRARLWKAQEMIRSGAHTIGQVAYSTGFADHSHLSVQFKRRFGVPPKAFLPAIRFV